MPIINFVMRILVLALFIHCLWNYPSAAIIIGVLTYFIIQLEKRVSVLEKEIEIERRLNREAYSTERYAPRPKERTSYPGYPS
jgi:hypothetical protein